MTTCNRTIQTTMRDVGIIGKYKCGKEVFKDGLCKGHYNRQQQKLIPWGQRINYIEATAEHMLAGRTMKLKSTHVHKLYRLRKNVIQQYTNATLNTWIETELSVDNTLFCVKN